MVNTSYYLFYVIFAIVSAWFNLIPAIVTGFVLTLIGILVRIKFYLPIATDGSSPWDNFITIFSGIDGVIAANAVIATAQPFLFNFITTFTDEYVSESVRGVYIGTTSVFANLGYAIGYLISVNTIQSDSEYRQKFANINYGHLAAALVTAIIAVVPYLYWRINIASIAGTANGTMTATTATAARPAAQEVVIDVVAGMREMVTSAPHPINNTHAMVAAAVYCVLIACSYTTSNYMQNLFSSMGFPDEQNLLASSLSISYPVSPFQPFLVLLSTERRSGWK